MDPATGYLVVAFIALLPWIELRGAIPVGVIVFGLDPLAVFALSVLVDILVFAPIFVCLTLFYGYVKRYGLVRGTVEGVRRKGEAAMNRYGFWGLAAFVAVPLPFTGAWTGTLIAWVFNLERKKAFMAVALGVLVAGVLVTLLSLFAAEALYWLGVPRASPI